MNFVIKIITALLALALLLAIGAYVFAGWSEKPLDDKARALAPGEFLTTDAGQLHYRWHGGGTGPVIVMAHGFSTPNFIFEQNADALVEAGFRVLTFDHFGRGWSDRPKAKYDPDFYDRELTDLLDGLDITDPIGLVGLSMGGIITAEFTARHPERVSKLFLFVPAGLSLGGEAGSANDRALRTPILGDWVFRVFGKSILLGDRQYDESQLAEANKLAGDVSEQMSYRGYFRALLSSYRHLPMRDQNTVFTRLSETGVPVMAVFGGKDTTVTPDSAQRLEALIPAARVDLLPSGEHGLNYQMNATTNPLIVNYFSNTP
ncbi:MAG: alpha/beta hydrolase [Hyphomonadaceae bacterium]